MNQQHKYLRSTLNKFIYAYKNKNTKLNPQSGNLDSTDIHGYEQAYVELELKLNELGFILPKTNLSGTYNKQFIDFVQELSRRLEKTNYKNLLNLWEKMYGPFKQKNQ